MDEMKIRSNFAKNIIANLISKLVKEKTGMYPVVTFKSPIEATIDDGFIDIHVDLNLGMTTDDISKLLKDLV